ncbi:6-phosphofructo-2-kinase-domain-containing protein [Boeremia exigua]|uniref:6-phosphofructo-2-kinase-domain-containing protein n=1 Tax=Boeremia exigua TaxID=749465 RepID=UPI001E8DD40F|nr:6-phosphofructo-2-kinase-domain-containing protein [Boeremia exigua]KAH6613010.1 6-phosphofructo-2-kinase-domain-containing protein [Boeremia exigua]
MPIEIPSPTGPIANEPDSDSIKHEGSKNGSLQDRDCIDEKLLIIMVGLPARGKSYVAKKLCRYLNWRQHPTRIFNVGDRRRRLTISPLGHPVTTGEHSATFFDPENREAQRTREAVALETLDRLLDFLLDPKAGAHCAIFDATNSTVDRRVAIVDRVRRRNERTLKALFVESHCYDERLLEMNMRLKLSGPDYKKLEPGLALEDFKLRVRMYEKKYTPLGYYEEQHDIPFCQMIDVGRKFVSHKIMGHLASQVATYLQHFNLQPRQIWLTRNAECAVDVSGLSGTDPGLSSQGVEFARALATAIDSQRKHWLERKHTIPLTDTQPPANEATDDGDNKIKGFSVWTSMMRRSVLTAQFLEKTRYKIRHTRMLDDVRAGVLREGSTSCSSNGCDANRDLVDRVNSVLLEMERTTDHVLLIGHSSVVSTLLAYFSGRDMGALQIPLGTVYRLEPVGAEIRVDFQN